MTKQIEIEIVSYTIQRSASNPCTLCDKTPKVGSVSFFLKGRFGTHILVHLCEEHWNDTGIFLALAKAFINEANRIESRSAPESDRLILILKDAIRRDPKLKKAFTPEVADKLS